MSREQEGFVRLATISDLEERGWLAVEYEGEHVLLVRNNDVIHAVRNVCAHRGASFVFNGKAQIRDSSVTCPAHGYTFDLRTGQCDRNPSLSIPTYEVRVEDKNVLVKLPLPDPQGNDGCDGIAMPGLKMRPM